MSSQSSAITVLAPAKVNLSLTIVRRRDDGYHELDSEFLAISLHDRLVLQPASDRSERSDGVRNARCGDRLTLTGPAATPDIPTDEGNLVLRMLAAWREHTQWPAALQVELHKAIPSRAGLGGGSSDAVAALVAAERLREQTTGQRLPPADCERLCAQLGSDLNFFLAVQRLGVSRARCRGRGELVEPLPSQPWWGVVAIPPLALATPAVFAHRADRNDWPHATNDLQPIAESLEPQLLAARRQLEVASHTSWVLSGSGSALFTSCRTAGQRERLLELLRESCDDVNRFTLVAVEEWRGDHVSPR